MENDTKEVSQLLNFFRTDDAKQFLTYVEEVRENLLKQAPQECKTNDEWQYRRGFLDGLHYIVNYPSMLAALLELEEENPEYV